MTGTGLYTPSQITIVTTCMGRLRFLKKTLPNWVSCTRFQILVVDYSCPDGTADWILRAGFSGRVRAIRCPAKKHEGRPMFHLSRARNFGAAYVPSGYLLFLDAETLITRDFEPWLLRNVGHQSMCVPVPIRGPSDIWGTLCIHKDVFRKAGGYDEGFVGWGAEDMDMRLRLHFLGMIGKKIPLGFLAALSHSNELRAKHHLETDYGKSRRMNEVYLERKLLGTTGRSFKEWRWDPAVRGFLFSGVRRGSVKKSVSRPSNRMAM